MVEEGWRWWRQVAFMDVVAAYEILGDPDKRAACDRDYETCLQKCKG